VSILMAVQAAQTDVPGRCFGPFDLLLEAGERVAILGPSGAGKSTLLKLMAGERALRAGAVMFETRAIAQWRAQDLALRRAVLAQTHAVAFGLKVELVVALGRIAHEPDAGQPRIVAAAMEAACASHLVGRRFDTLSGGEQARVQLARVMAQLWDSRRGLLLVDEPLSALDPGLQFELMDALLVFTHQRGHALVAVLHDMNQALQGFDRLWLVKAGQLVADITSGRDAVPALAQLFGIRLRCVDDPDRPGDRVAVLAQRAPAFSLARGPARMVNA
jgi:iron complex transport system ATP-binding protein